jgi:hypothetical protein
MAQDAKSIRAAKALIRDVLTNPDASPDQLAGALLRGLLLQQYSESGSVSGGEVGKALEGAAQMRSATGEHGGAGGLKEMFGQEFIELGDDDA